MKLFDATRSCCPLFAAAFILSTGTQLLRANATTHEHYVQLAQAGSVGGRVGRGKKDLSGGVKNTRRKTVSKRKAVSSCRRVIGRWSWTHVFGTWIVNFKTNNKVINNVGLSGDWTCSGGKYTVVWWHGARETFSIAADGRNLKGQGNFGITIVGVRQ